MHAATHGPHHVSTTYASATPPAHVPRHAHLFRRIRSQPFIVLDMPLVDLIHMQRSFPCVELRYGVERERACVAVDTDESGDEFGEETTNM